ncbi:unnamed protein product [Mytilus coruscus]|uniref:ISXO2-like transposase domain-containing protein n=1 Tax=Mytilus coruscus TaxID=42192 RepID=A0A6J8BJZ3_MYTCO|nr:unnamed protein product [Mytilus coruscus]
MEYKSTSVHLASYIREMFCEYIYTEYEIIRFQGDVELDESLFGRKIKYNRGKPTGNRIWIFGMIERSSNKIVMYPVDSRGADVLITLIQKHVEPGSRIFSDSWGAYSGLNRLGYEQFTVIHKTSFKQLYINTETNEEVQCCTNRIEGAWKIAKDHFRRINGTNSNLFEQHLCEIVWRNHVHRAGNIYSSFFDLMKNVYTLEMPPRFTYTKPLFRTWTPPSKADEARHNITIVQGSDAESDGEEASTVETSEPTCSSLPASSENSEHVQGPSKACSSGRNVTCTKKTSKPILDLTEYLK